MRTLHTLAPEESWAAAEGGAPPPGGPPPGERYVTVERLHVSNLSEVWRVYDRELDRQLARKTLRAGLGPRSREAFLREAVLTARLNRPGVIPILDRGVGPDGLPWYLMPLMAWRTLEQWLLAGGRPDGAAVRQRVEVLRDICWIVGFAHTEHRIVHCDLKPGNVLVGAHREVIVLDWGLAVELDAPTREDLRSGTPGYRPPEQALGRGAELGPWSDVYALGATLWAALRVAAPPDHPRKPDPSVLPDGLDAIARRALADRPEDRHPDARALADALTGWLDGAYRRERALEELARARALDGAARVVAERAEALRRQARQAGEGVRPFAPVEQKRAVWVLEDRAAAEERERAIAEAGRAEAVRRALVHDPDLPEAHAFLAELHHHDHRAAEAVGDEAAAARHEAALRVHDRVGRYAAYLDGHGVRVVEVDAVDAEVWWDTLVEEDRRLVPRTVGLVGRGSRVEVRLPRGSHRLRVVAPGRQEVGVPVCLGRAEVDDGAPPGGAAWPLRLPRVGELGEDERLVPGGWFRSGGDEAAPEGLSPRRLWVDSFVVRRDPVTVGEYFAFLDALVAAGREDEALARAPRDRENVAYDRLPDGRFVPGGAAFGAEPWGLDWPVVLVSWEDAEAFARWEAERTGLPWRLPHDQEREKAARGVDGRLYPWGTYPEPTWSNMAGSVPGRPTRVPVGALVHDVGPYGARGMAGNSRDWCANRYDRLGPPDGSRVDPLDPGPPGPFRFARGGAADAIPRLCRVDARYAAAPDRRSSAGGIRLVRSWGVTSG